MAFRENYYQKYDIFRIDATKQQCQVVSRPLRRRDDYWEVQVRLIDNNLDTILDVDGCQPGMTTTFQSIAINGSGIIKKLINLRNYYEELRQQRRVHKYKLK